MSEGGIKKSKSKLSSMIVEKEEGPGETAVNIYYSKDDWATSKNIVISIEDNTTISQLTDFALCQIPSLGTENLEKKQNFYMMLYKKKKQKPNYDYPICNPDSLVKDYDKYNFCLMEKKTEEKEKNNVEEKNTNKNKEEVKKKDSNDVSNENVNKKKNDKENNKKEKDKKCIIF